MSNTILIVIIAVVIVAALMIWAYRTRRARLKARFGPEYDRVAHEAGSARRADATLDARARRVNRYEIRPLTPEQGEHFSNAWRVVQARFVDDPSAAVAEADALVTELMNARGYPMSDFDRRAEDLSVDHATVVHHYREAHAIAIQHTERGSSTEDLRQAVVHYRELFNELLEVREPERKRA